MSYTPQAFVHYAGSDLDQIEVTIYNAQGSCVYKRFHGIAWIFRIPLGSHPDTGIPFAIKGVINRSNNELVARGARKLAQDKGLTFDDMTG